MSSVFSTGKPPVFSTEQKKERRLAWKPSSNRAKMHACRAPVVLFRSEARQAELAAKIEATKA